MADSYLQLPADGAGKKLRTRTRVQGPDTVHEQAVFEGASPTYYIWVTPMATAQNKYLLALLNTGTQVVRVKKLFLINAALTAVTGVGMQYDVKRSSTITGGTAVTPNPADTADGAVSGLTCVHSPTSVTEGVLLYSWFTNNDEVGATNAFPSNYLQALGNIQPEGPEIRELTLRQNEGCTVKQITSTAVGIYGVLAVITVEA